jgi:PAS domain-containing protein
VRILACRIGTALPLVQIRESVAVLVLLAAATPALADIVEKKQSIDEKIAGLQDRVQATKDREAELQQEIDDRKRVEDDLRKSEARLRLALDAGNLGTWEWDIEGKTIRWSAELERMHGLVEGAFAGTFEAYQTDIHPADR